MNAVINDANVSISELAERTTFRADETPVMRDTTTKTLSGTRNSADSYKRKGKPRRVTAGSHKLSVGMDNEEKKRDGP